jgi:heat shock protein HtpX
LSRLRLPLVVCACCLFWAFLGALLGACFRHVLGGLILGLFFGIGYVWVGSLAAEKFPLDVWDAQLLENSWAPNLYEMLHELCAKTDMALPTLYHIPRLEPNAFVVAGRDGNTAIIVTSGLTRHMEKAEVQAVAALMMARLATEVMPVWTITATLAGMPLHLGLRLQQRRGLAWLGAAILALFAYPAAGLARLAWNEGIITAADYHAAHLAEWPGALETALAKMEAAWPGSEEQAMAGNPATAFLFAVPPLAAPPTGAPFWRRALAVFPYRQPNVAARAARLLAKPTPIPVEPA